MNWTYLWNRSEGGNPVEVGTANPLPVALAGAATWAATILEGSCCPASTSVPEALTNTSSLVAGVTLYGRRGARTSNTNTVWYGFSSGDGSQQKPISSGSSVTVTAPPGKLIELSTLFVDAEVAGDGVQWISLK